MNDTLLSLIVPLTTLPFCDEDELSVIFITLREEEVKCVLLESVKRGWVSVTNSLLFICEEEEEEEEEEEGRIVMEFILSEPEEREKRELSNRDSTISNVTYSNERFEPSITNMEEEV